MRDLLNLMSALYAVVTLSVFIGIGVSAATGMQLPYAESILSLLLTTSLLTAIVTIPLYSDIPERVDRVIYSGIGRIPVLNKVVA